MSSTFLLIATGFSHNLSKKLDACENVFFSLAVKSKFSELKTILKLEFATDNSLETFRNIHQSYNSIVGPPPSPLLKEAGGGVGVGPSEN